MYRWRRGDDWQARGSRAKNQTCSPRAVSTFNTLFFFFALAKDIEPGLHEVMKTVEPGLHEVMKTVEPGLHEVMKTAVSKNYLQN